MATQKAVIIESKGLAKVSEVPFPTLRDDYIIVRTKAVALNPTDWKHIHGIGASGVIIGCDYSGIVEQVGKSVTNDLKPGDRVAGMVHGSNSLNKDSGAFAEHVLAKGDLQIKIPGNLSFEQAATLGVGVSTVGQGLYQSLGLPLPTNPAKESFPVIIYGGSTATGSLAIQYAKLSGLEVAATASQRNFDLLRAVGADHVFDYKSPTCGEDIRKATKDRVAHAFDTIGSQESAAICCAGIGSRGGKYSSIIRVEGLPREDVSNALTLAYTIVGEDIQLGGKTIKAKPEDFEFAKSFWKIARDLLEQGKLKVYPPEVREGGLPGILKGLDDLKEGRVSGVKLVYRVG